MLFKKIRKLIASQVEPDSLMASQHDYITLICIKSICYFTSILGMFKCVLALKLEYKPLRAGPGSPQLSPHRFWCNGVGKCCLLEWLCPGAGAGRNVLNLHH